MAIDIYKSGQGKWTRNITFGAGSFIGATIAYYVWTQLTGSLSRSRMYVTYGVPLVILLGVGYLMFWIVNRPGPADFMIATEGEMKKVSWSSRAEIIGGTKVVIATTLTMSLLLWAVDLCFGYFFWKIGVLIGATNS